MSMNNPDINQIEQIFNKATSANAEADLIVNQQQSLGLKANQGELEEYKVSSTQIFGLRVIKAGKVGIAYSEANDESALSSMVEQAILNASFSAIEPHETLLNNALSLSTDDALLCPADDSTIDEKIALTLELESTLLAQPKIKNVPYNGIHDSVSQQSIYSTAGLNAQSKHRSISAYAYALAEDGEKNAMEGVGRVNRLFQQISAQEIIDESYENCMAMLEGKPIASKHYDVIFDKECQISLFSAFATIFSGKSAKDGINPWREKVGEAVVDERLQIFDNPLNSDGFGYELFDSEGTSTRKTALIADGQLKTLLHNSVTANHFAVETTGHATRGPKSTLNVHQHQLEIAAGNDKAPKLQADEYVEITSLDGLHSGVNAISGDFSLGAAGFLCREGERVHAIRGIVVAGNFYQMLKEQIACIGETQYWNWQKSALMPSIRFSDMAISGA